MQRFIVKSASLVSAIGVIGLFGSGVVAQSSAAKPSVEARAVGADGKAADPADSRIKGQINIRAEDGRVLIASDQIRSYEWATHTLTLAPKVREELAARLLQSRRLVSGIPFAVAVGGSTVYKGMFTSLVSSRSFSTAVIVVDQLPSDSTKGKDQIRIQFGYPTREFAGKMKDPRADRHLREALKANGKLTEEEKKNSQ